MEPPKHTEITVSLLSDIIAVAPVATLVIDSGGNIAVANAAAASLWQMQRTDLVGRRAEVLVADRAREKLLGLCIQSASRAATESAVAVVSAARADGTEFSVEFSMRQVRLTDATYLWATIHPVPIPEAVAILANMAHDLRASLNCVIGFAEFLGDEKPGPLNHRQKDYLTEVLSAGRTQLQLIDDLIQLVKVAAGTIEVRAQTFGLKEALEELRTDMVRAAGVGAAQLRLDAPQRSVTFDREKLLHVIRSLTRTFLHLAGPGGEVSITIGCTGNFVEIDVHADRLGAPSSAAVLSNGGRDHIDEKLVRTGSAAYLSVASTRKLVDFLGGNVTIASSADLSSTHCAIRLPMLGSDCLRAGDRRRDG